MLYANVGAQKLRATKGARGTCPMCGAEVRAKCGDIVIWHWAHAASADCDDWYEPESEWHLGWKKALEQRGAEVEVTMTKGDRTHRADAVLPDGTVVELQHGYLTAEKIQARERFYGPNLLWVYDADQWASRIVWNHDGLIWKRPAPSMAQHRHPVYWDLLYPFQKADIGPYNPADLARGRVRNTTLMARHRNVDGMQWTEREEAEAPPNEIVAVQLRYIEHDDKRTMVGRWSAYSYEDFFADFSMTYADRAAREHLAMVDAADPRSPNVVERIWAQVAASRNRARTEGWL